MSRWDTLGAAAGCCKQHSLSPRDFCVRFGDFTQMEYPLTPYRRKRRPELLDGQYDKAFVLWSVP